MGEIDNTNRDFWLEAGYVRDGAVLEKFIRMNIEEGNHIITDSWLGYNFMNRPNSGYIHISHNHGRENFGLGEESTSHIEGLWSILKGKIKSTYKVISSKYKNIILFISEAEFKFKNRDKNYIGIIKEFFSCYDYIENVKANQFNPSQFLGDESDSFSSNDSN